MQKPTRKSIVKRLDQIVSKIVQARERSVYDKCPFCRQNDINNAFHFITRGKYILRWDIELNVVGSCWPCNSKFSGKWGGGNQAPFWKWYLEHLGKEKFELLEAKSHTIAAYSTPDLRERLVFFERSFPQFS